MAKPKLNLGSYEIHSGCEPYVIAEIGVNHEGSFEKAVELIDLAHRGGAHAAKFQSYKAGKIAARHSPSYWDLKSEPTTSQYELFKKYDSFEPEHYQRLAKHCQQIGIDFLSTPFDLGAIDFLDPLMPFFKVASADLTNVPFLRKVALKNKPVLLSTGASRLGEVDFALKTLQETGCKDIVLLHCILNYPTPDANAHLNMIEDLKRNYPDFLIGYSDHTLPDPAMTSLTTSYLKGATVIEKHFTHDKTLPGNDHYHAMDWQDLHQYWQQLTKIRALEGRTHKSPIPTEEISRKNARRSVVTSRDLASGDHLSIETVVTKRPGTGIPAIYWDQVMGARLKRNLPEDSIVQWSDVTFENERSRVVAVVQARMGSQRFPGKMLALLSGKPLIEWILRRLQGAKEIDEIILATTTQEKDRALAFEAEKLGIQTFFGDETDVLGRVTAAARKSGADAVVRVCGDNPFIDPQEVDRLVQYFRTHPCDYAFNHLSKMGNEYPDGFGAEILSMRVLEELDRHAEGPQQREHLANYIWDYPYAFDIQTIRAPNEIAQPGLKFDVDQPQDLKRLEKLSEGVGIMGTAQEFVRFALEVENR